MSGVVRRLSLARLQAMEIGTVVQTGDGTCWRLDTPNRWLDSQGSATTRVLWTDHRPDRVVAIQLELPEVTT